MARHFLLSAAARTITLASVARMSVEEAERVFIRLRWSGNDGNAYCPHCGCTTVWMACRPSGAARWRCPLALQSLPQGFLGHERHAIRLPQDAAAVLPDGDRDLRERGQGQVNAGTKPRSRDAVQNIVRAGA